MPPRPAVDLALRLTIRHLRGSLRLVQLLLDLALHLTILQLRLTNALVDLT